MKSEQLLLIRGLEKSISFRY